MIFMYGHPQNNPWLEIKTAHSRAPLRANFQKNAIFEISTKIHDITISTFNNIQKDVAIVLGTPE